MGQLRDTGNKAFKAGDWKKAIDFYSQAIAVDAKDVSLFSNRSAAYMKLEEYQKAVDDADRCIQMKADYHKGYSRKGAAQHALQRYDEAIVTYTQGLKACPKVQTLEMGLAASNRAKAETSQANAALQSSKAAQRASRNQHVAARKETSISGFISKKRRELKLQIASLEAQLDFIDGLDKMTDAELMKLLFNVVDNDRDGKVCAKELAFALRRRNSELTLDAALNRAINAVAIFDQDGDARLNMHEFEEYVRVLLTELNISFQEFSEYMVLQTLFAEPSEAIVKEEKQVDRDEMDQRVKNRGHLLQILGDERLFEIFGLFDKDNKGNLTFNDVAIGLYPLIQDMEKSAKTTMELLLMMDKEAPSTASAKEASTSQPLPKRTINYEQFGRLIMAVVATRNSSFDEVADELVLALTSKNKKSAPHDLANLMVADEVYASFQKTQQDQENRDVVSHGRLHRLFVMLDTNQDGKIDFDELKRGFSQFEKSLGRLPNAEKEAQVFMNVSSSSNQQSMDQAEFVRAVSQYAKVFKVDLHELIDFMCISAVLPNERADMFAQAYRESFSSPSPPKRQKKNSRRPSIPLNDSLSLDNHDLMAELSGSRSRDDNDSDAGTHASSDSIQNFAASFTLNESPVPVSPLTPRRSPRHSKKSEKNKMSQKMGSSAGSSNDDTSLSDLQVPLSPSTPSRKGKKKSRHRKSTSDVSYDGSVSDFPSSSEKSPSRLKLKKKRVPIVLSDDEEDEDDAVQNFRIRK